MRHHRFRFFLLALTLGVVSCAQALPESAVIRRVIDGDTVELGGGRLVRYIGIDTPELRRKIGGQWVEDPEPFGQAAKEANARLVAGKTVRLEYDVETHDRYGRLLAYVYVDGTMVNATLLAGGYAQPLTIPPNVRHVEEFRRLVKEARDAKRGLWASTSSQRKKRAR
ncbi:MAG: thermonuclease family protein [Candidatus Omnitrophica bacterium]|nr:thermonuclease family protein [Candidatus Omnitrophota bacterium]